MYVCMYMIGGKPVQAYTSVLVLCWEQCIWRIWCWHFMRNASNVFPSQESGAHATYSSTNTGVAAHSYLLR